MDPLNPETRHEKEAEKESLFERFVGPNAAYYLLTWASMKGRWVSWNWSAFVFGDAWLFYRKMYFYGIIYTLIRILLTPLVTTPNFLKTPFDLDLLALLAPHTLIMNLALGIVGNQLYFQYAQRKVLPASAKYAANHLPLRIESIGGVSLAALLLIPLLALLENLIPFLLENNFSYQWFQRSQTF